MSQMSLFAAGMSDPSFDDLEGLLAGPGSIERRGDAARVSVLVADGWRAEVLLRGLSALGPGAQAEACPDGVLVQTPLVPQLCAVAQRWFSPAGKHAPAGLRVDGARLWWWCIAAGGGDSAGYRLGLGRADGDEVWSAAGAALATAGVTAALVGRGQRAAEGPAYRVVGARRLVRLAELVGAAPQGVPPAAWPTVGQPHVGMAQPPGIRAAGNYGDPSPS
ncbi:MAG: hypothetical protein QOE76_1915 [Frankiales bacterium]|jgi:hypothetical protein|nr:hypothetical protein [Frankiales bacterium]